MLAADKKFHDLFVQCARNAFATRSMNSIGPLSHRFWLAHRGHTADRPVFARLHGDIALAIAEGDAEAALQASDRLADYPDEFTRSTLDRHR